MTYLRLKKLTAGFLTGDNTLPSDDDVVIELVGAALETVAMQADSLHLMTLSTTADVLRLSSGDYLIRRPILPEDDVDMIDIDEDLMRAVARYVASYISSEKGGIHVNAADRIIKDYNGKTWEIIDQMEVEAEAVGVEEICYVAPDTEWTL